MTPLVSCLGISKSFGSRRLFSDISLGFFEHERLGLIGTNGSGKSTLLKILAGLEQPDAGQISRRKHCQLVYLPQEDQFDLEQSVEQTVYQSLLQLDMDESERQVQTQRMLSRAAFVDNQQKVGHLSGGWRKRLALTRALAQNPDLLFLDEPTNHLDIEGILWLEELLRQASFGYVLVTHDRYFLQHSTDHVLELSGRYPDGFLKVAGNYSDFLCQRDAALQQQAQQETTLSNKVRREVEWLRRGPKARTTKARYRTDSAHELIDELAQVKKRNALKDKVKIEFDSTDRKTKKLLLASELSCTIGERTLFSNATLNLLPKVRIGLLGNNGVGKSTLLRVLAGQQQPDTGTLVYAQGVKLLTFEQDRSTLQPDLSLRRALAPQGDTVIYQGKPVHVAGWAARFLFRAEQLELPVASLSGGEQARILIARLMLQPADILLLDEPTNDLDIPSLEVLENSLLEFPGAIVLVTHDRYLLDRVCTGVLGIDSRGGVLSCADHQQWMELQKQQRQEKKVPKAPRVKNKKATGLTYAERLELKQLEGDIEQAEAEVAQCELQVQQPEVASDPERLRQQATALDESQKRLDELYQRWEVLETKREGG